MYKSKLNYLRDLNSEIEKLTKRRNRLYTNQEKNMRKINYINERIAHLKKEKDALNEEILVWLKQSGMNYTLMQGVKAYYCEGKSWVFVKNLPGCKNLLRDLEHSLYNPPKA